MGHFGLKVRALANNVSLQAQAKATREPNLRNF